ncbi:voltage-gated sodium channel [Aureococcus anophagefferens]|uniref:Voltage-gated sodium channel n=1 Tax=Aureococcus anophagefferens TaxID=44056 RepID=A0ABR1FLH2_AURAN
MDGDGEDLATFESDAESRAYGEREMVTPRLPAAEPEPPRARPGIRREAAARRRRSLDDQGTPVQYTRALDDEEPETVAAPNFFVDGVAYRFAADRALGCAPSSEQRKRAVAVVVHPAFDAVILVAILVNAAFMGMVDYGSVGEDPDLEMYYKPKGGWRNDLIEQAEIPFTALFLVEFVLKVFAMGFAGEEGAYLSDNWNLVDFVVVLTSLFMGQLHGRCRTTPYPVVANYSLYGNGTNYADFAVWYDAKDCYWPLDEDDGRFCALHTGGPGLHKCAHATSKLAPDEWRWCGSNYDALGNLRFTPLKKRDAGDGDGPIESWFHAGAKQGDDSGVWSEDLNFGYTPFDNYLLGLVTIFQTITLEGWSDVMFMYEDAGDPTVAALFFTCMVIFGSFILLNLVLAVLENSLEEEDDGAEAPDPEYEAACRRADELHEAGKYKSPFQKAVLSEGFDYFFTLLIVGNTIVLAMDHKGIDPAEERLHELILFVLGVLFAVEMVLKIAALGLAPYFAVS